jgi:integrase
MTSGSRYQVELSVRIFREFQLARGLSNDQLKEHHILEFLEVLDERKGIKDNLGRTYFSTASKRKILNNCRAVYELAGVSRDIWKKALARTPLSETPEKRLGGALTDDEVKELIRKLPNTRNGHILGAFIGLAFGASLRRGEILNLRIGEIKFTLGKLVCRLTNTKTGKTYEDHVISPQMAVFVTKMMHFRLGEGARPQDRLITSLRNDRYTPDSFNKLLREYAQKVLGFSISSHWGRYTVTTKQLIEKEDPIKIMKYGRWTSLRMVLRYNRLIYNAENSLGNKLHYD